MISERKIPVTLAVSRPLEPGLSVVVPVYRSEKSLEPLIDRLLPVLDSFGTPFEVVCVNDGSPDRSWEVLAALVDRWPGKIVAVNLMRNFGQHAALLCGIRAARFGVVVTMDDDLQHPPEEIGKLLAALRTGHDVVYATPQRERHGLFRNVASVATKRALEWATGVPIFSKISAFRAFRTELRDAFANFEGPAMSIDVLLTWGTSKFGTVETRRDARVHGKSNYTFGKLVLHTLNMVTGFGATPLRLVFYLGAIVAALGMFGLLGQLLAAAIVGSAGASAWLAAWTTFLLGLNLLSMSAIGEYLGRIHPHAISRPGYVIREAIDATTSVSQADNAPAHRAA